MKQISRVSLFFASILLIGCVSLTVNVYFPTEKIEKAAEEIEERIRSGQGTDGMDETSLLLPAAPAPQRYTFEIGLAVQTAHAQEMDIDIDTKVVREVIESRAERYEDLEPYLDDGTFGEGMDGFLVLRKTEGLDLRTLTQLKKLVKEENADRTKLYTEILRVNELEVDEDNLERVGKTFFEAIKKKMGIGHWYQADEEEWKQKTKEDHEKWNEEE